MDKEYIKGERLNPVIRHPTEPKCPVVLLIDTSESMAGEKINSLNSGVNLLINTLKNDEIAHKRVELSIVSFNSVVDVIQDFAVVDDMPVVNLNASGFTLMGQAIITGIDLISTRKEIYKSGGIDYYRPWIWLITDGTPTDMGPRDGKYYETYDDVTASGESINMPESFFETWDNVIKSVHDGENNHNFAFFAVGVEGADMQTLSEISVRAPVKLNGVNFKDMFLWLSKSLSNISHSGTNDQISLSSPDSWGKITPK